MKLVARTPIYNVYMKPLSSRGREGESATIASMVHELFGESILCHKENGAPFIAGSEKQISISHGAGFAVIAISNYPIGVDIEAPRMQLERIRHKFMRDSDAAETLLHAWTAKEAAFKAGGVDGVTVHDIRVDNCRAFVPGSGWKTIDFYDFGAYLIAVAH